MQLWKPVYCCGRIYQVLLSDEPEALLKAVRSNKPAVGIFPADGLPPDLFAVPYIVENQEDAGTKYLEQVICRCAQMPWEVAETSRLKIREFQPADAKNIPVLADDSEQDRIFSDSERLKAYIRYQYGIYQFGIWALEEKQTGRLVGKAGLTPLGDSGAIQLGYQIFPEYQRIGLALEACRKILDTAWRYFSYWQVYAEIQPGNPASIGLAEKLGFVPVNQRCSELKKGHLRYVWNCPQWRDNNQPHQS